MPARNHEKGFQISRHHRQGDRSDCDLQNRSTNPCWKSDSVLWFEESMFGVWFRSKHDMVAERSMSGVFTPEGKIAFTLSWYKCCAAHVQISTQMRTMRDPPPLFNSIINSGEEANYWLIIRLSVSWLGERVYEPRCGISPSLSKRGHPHCRALQWSGFGLLQSLIDLEWGCILTPIYSCLADTSCKLFFLDVDNRSRSNTLLCVIMKIWL